MLTRRQKEILVYIKTYIAANDGIAPSFDEIKSFFGYASKGVVHRHLTALEERGRLRRLPNRARAMEVLEPAQTIVCPSCDHSLRPGANFCDSCGLPLQRAAA